MTTPGAEDVLHFWFGELKVNDDVDLTASSRWFHAAPAFDAEIAARFGVLWREAVKGRLDTWRATPRSALGLIILLDQFSRNLNRGSHLAYVADAAALDIAMQLVDDGTWLGLRLIERTFVALPFEHAPDHLSQATSVGMFQMLLDHAPPQHRALFAEYLEHALEHQATIRRAGVFPQRAAFIDCTCGSSGGGWSRAVTRAIGNAAPGPLQDLGHRRDVARIGLQASMAFPLETPVERYLISRR